MADNVHKHELAKILNKDSSYRILKMLKKSSYQEPKNQKKQNYRTIQDRKQILEELEILSLECRTFFI